MEREQPVDRGAGDPLPPHRAHDEELGHQERACEKAADQCEADGDLVAIEEVGGAVPVRLEERDERPLVEPSVLVGQ